MKPSSARWPPSWRPSSPTRPSSRTPRTSSWSAAPDSLCAGAAGACCTTWPRFTTRRSQPNPGLIDLARHPLGVLQRLLNHDPDPVALRKVNVDPDAADRAHAQWQKLINAVELTTYEWDIADSAAKTSIERSRATVADVAAVAEAAAALDQHLPARSLSTASPPGRSLD